MNHVRWIASVLPLAVLVVGCERKEARVTAPPPPERFEAIEARWVWGKELAAAVQGAAASPLVQRAIVDAPNPRLTARWDLAVRAEGRMSDGSRVGVTILPYVVDQDPSHALFISYRETDGRRLAESSELILGREPTSLETGFVPVSLGGKIGWLKTGASYKDGAGEVVALSPEKLDFAKFAQCFFERAPLYCSAGSQIAEQIAPGFPYASAIGCGIGVAAAAVACAGIWL